MVLSFTTKPSIGNELAMSVENGSMAHRMVSIRLSPVLSEPSLSTQTKYKLFEGFGDQRIYTFRLYWIAAHLCLNTILTTDNRHQYFMAWL